MAAALFDFAAERLEHHAGFNRLEARGTLRIALKVAGLDVGSVTAGQLCVVFEKVMPVELEKRGVKNAAEVCGAVIEALANEAPSDTRQQYLDNLRWIQQAGENKHPFTPPKAIGARPEPEVVTESPIAEYCCPDCGKPVKWHDSKDKWICSNRGPCGHAFEAQQFQAQEAKA